MEKLVVFLNWAQAPGQMTGAKAESGENPVPSIPRSFSL